MKRFVIIVSIVLLIAAAYTIFVALKRDPISTSLPRDDISMKLSSLAFEHNKKIPPRFTCDGENINPPLLISDVPENAQSLVLIHDDPDAPRDTWVHWTLWDIAPETKEIKENSVPVGAEEGTTSFGSTGYGGPCPPSGTHRYFFKLYALDTGLHLPSTARASDIERIMAGHILAQTELVGLYERTR